jgi:hypothetical protein
MGFVSWLQRKYGRRPGGMSTGLAAVDEVFHPLRHKQMEILHEARERAVDVTANGRDVDIERGLAIIRRRSPT